MHGYTRRGRSQSQSSLVSTLYSTLTPRDRMNGWELAQTAIAGDSKQLQLHMLTGPCVHGAMTHGPFICHEPFVMGRSLE